MYTESEYFYDFTYMSAFHHLQKLLYVITIFGSSVLAENTENSVSRPNNLAAPLPLESNSETNSPPPDNETYEEEAFI